MNKIVLFSPVGGTDPISSSNLRDGSLLHICRVYKPDKVILYMSKEILENHRKDNRYFYCLDRLSDVIDKKMTYEIIEREDLENVHEFDYYYQDFRQLLEKIVNDLDDTDILYLNVSSGTPSMKSVLLVLHTLGEIPCRSIQVATPVKKMNQHDHLNYDVEMLWELNEDNGEGFYNRCKEIECPTLSLIKREEIIKQHIRSYDYHAAVEAASSLKKEEREKYWDLLKMAEARELLDFAEVDRVLRKNRTFELPFASGEERKYFEYALSVGLKMKKKQNADFIRSLTPLILDLFQLILKDRFNLDIYDYCTEEESGLCWSEEKLFRSSLDTILQMKYKSRFNYGHVYSDSLYKVIRYLSDDRNLNEVCYNIHDIEQSVRNIAAHQIVTMTDRRVKELTGGKSAGDIYGFIIELFKYTSLSIRPEYWDSVSIG